ncbi:MAG: phenylalanine--tRNA ligase subunit alpha [Omnitrophica bacterium RIFCSPHIGHO2_02_FULL_51_18]|nr:MAG: phenylalanine--tRNA ligase subunit alpha [Omnitrophica bacterium RIFCSPHIGHO2_02_FULL_51_18]
MIEALKEIETRAKEEALVVRDAKAFEALKNKYLGRKGLFAFLTARISEVAPEERRAVGQEMNRVKQALEEIFSEYGKSLGASGAVYTKEIDTTMPGTYPAAGSLHPLTLVVQEVTSIFERLGFRAVDWFEAEDERHNFDALNIPTDHPARDSFDNFYLDDPVDGERNLLRSQTSTVQIRFMDWVKETKRRPPFKIIAPGKVYRPDATDATHSFMFHQIEGLYVDEDVSFAHLKGVLERFAKEFFGPETMTQFRPHFFPFTEPSAEMDVQWESRGWLEILGAGMVHPRVLRAVNIDPQRYSGFAFGMGVERMAMLKYGVKDIRQFFENDIRFLRQFA